MCFAPPRPSRDQFINIIKSNLVFRLRCGEIIIRNVTESDGEEARTFKRWRRRLLFPPGSDVIVPAETRATATNTNTNALVCECERLPAWLGEVIGS